MSDRIILVVTLLVIIVIIQFSSLEINNVNFTKMKIINSVFGDKNSKSTSNGASSTASSSNTSTNDLETTNTSSNDVSSTASSSSASSNDVSSTASSSSVSSSDVGNKKAVTNHGQSSKTSSNDVGTTTDSTTISNNIGSTTTSTDILNSTTNTLTFLINANQTLIESALKEFDLLPTETKDFAARTVLIPPTITNVTETSGQTVIALLSKIIPGKEILISVDDSSIPDYGGLKQIILPVSEKAKPRGETLPEEWFVIETSKTIPSSITSKNLIKPILFVSVSYPFEETARGYDWGDPDTYSSAPTMTLVINKTDSSEIQYDSVGCPIIEAYTLSSGSWTSNGLGEISSWSVSQTQCFVTIQTQHFSKFAISLKPLYSTENTGPGQFGIGTLVTDLNGPRSSVIGDENSAEPFSVQLLMNFFFPGIMANAEPVEGFSNLECSQRRNHVVMSGKYTNDDMPYKLIFLKLYLLDHNGKILSSAGDYISDLNSHETKRFQIVTRHNGNYDSCSVQIQQKFTETLEFSIKQIN